MILVQWSKCTGQKVIRMISFLMPLHLDRDTCHNWRDTLRMGCHRDTALEGTARMCIYNSWNENTKNASMCQTRAVPAITCSTVRQYAHYLCFNKTKKKLDSGADLF